jgi:DNA-binding NarL/FixJ family response regulator
MMEPTMHVLRDAATYGGVVPLRSSAREQTGAGTNPMATRVLLAESERLVRAGLRALLEGEPGLTVVGEAANGEDAVAAAAQHRPDVALVAVRLPRLDGPEAVRRIVADARGRPVRALMLTTEATDVELFGAIRAGASGVLLRDSDPAELRRAVRAVARGAAHLSPSLIRRVIDELAALPDLGLPTPEQLEELTTREREVLALVGIGLSDDEIAGQLVMTPATAKTHVSRTMIKLDARDRAKLVRIAYETGLVQPRASRAGVGTPDSCHARRGAPRDMAASR